MSVVVREEEGRRGVARYVQLKKKRINVILYMYSAECMCHFYAEVQQQKPLVQSYSASNPCTRKWQIRGKTKKIIGGGLMSYRRSGQSNLQPRRRQCSGEWVPCGLPQSNGCGTTI